MENALQLLPDIYQIKIYYSLSIWEPKPRGGFYVPVCLPHVILFSLSPLALKTKIQKFSTLGINNLYDKGSAPFHIFFQSVFENRFPSNRLT